jgi:subtilisin-like proprotein convertase family protein
MISNSARGMASAVACPPLSATIASAEPWTTRAGTLSSEPANGTWKLRVQDAAAADVGRIDSWTINL